MLLWVSISHSKQFKTTPFLLKLLRPSVRRKGCFNQTAFWVTLSLKVSQVTCNLLKDGIGSALWTNKLLVSLKKKGKGK